MKKIGILFLGLFIFTACGGDGAVSVVDADKDDIAVAEKYLYVAKNAGFRVDFPGEPEVSNESVETEVGAVAVTYYINEIGDTAYMVTYSEYPDGFLENMDKEAMLQGGMRGGLEVWGITEAKESREISFNGNKGLYYRADNGEYFAVAYLYLVGESLYQVVIIKQGVYPVADKVSGFIGSFELLQ